jgi:nucleotide-binding universal stress UspA family protein
MNAQTQVRSVLALVSDSPRSAAVLGLAQRLAASQGAQLRALHAVAPSASGAYLTPEASALAFQLRSEVDGQRSARAAELVAQVGAAIPFESLLSESPQEVLQRARSCDLLVTGQPDPATPDGTAPGLVSRLLVAGGCPLLFVPYAVDTPLERCGSRVLVAWSDSRESARALRDALPLLRAAKHVELARFAGHDEAGPEPLERARDYLALHGVQAQTQVLHGRESSLSERLAANWTPDAPVAEALLSHAADIDADLIVMGGYGHARLWELVLGGVTRTMLQAMTVPVLMSH